MNLSNIVYINLEHRTDKKDFIENILSHSQCTVNKIAAIKPTAQHPKGPQHLWDLKMYDRYYGVLGCFLSHIKSLEYLISRNLPPNEYSLIVEDDAYIHPKFWDVVKQIDSYINMADIIFFDSCNNNAATCGVFSMISNRYPICYNISGENAYHKVLENADPIMYFFGTHCLSIQNRKLQRILNILNDCSQILDIDLFYILNPNLLKFCIQTNLVHQAQAHFKTDIVKDPINNLDATPGVKDVT